MHDLALLPPRCCGERVPPSVIANALTKEEMELFQECEMERDTKDKTYCSNAECGKFIATQLVRRVRRVSDRGSEIAICPAIGPSATTIVGGVSQNERRRGRMGGERVRKRVKRGESERKGSKIVYR